MFRLIDLAALYGLAGTGAYRDRNGGHRGDDQLSIPEFRGDFGYANPTVFVQRDRHRSRRTATPSAW